MVEVFDLQQYEHKTPINSLLTKYAAGWSSGSSSGS